MVAPIQFPAKVVKRFVFLLITEDEQCSYGFADAPTVEEALAYFTRDRSLDELTKMARILYVETDNMETIDDPHTLITAAVESLFKGNNG